jgi:heterodisulfide reductase subunit C
MGEMLRYQSQQRRHIESESRADVSLCWTCGSCDSECPVNIATGRLRPQKIVRMSVLGLLEELSCLPEIWYCMTCRRCAQICPNTVSPAAVIEYIRREMLSRNQISRESLQQYRDLYSRFQRVRWRAAAAALQGKTVELTESRWERWLAAPIPPPGFGVISGDVMQAFSTIGKPIQETRILRCFTCGECSSACPIACHRNVFDPRALFRRIHLGLTEELIRSPALWLCLECNRCTEACTQSVDGRRMIRFLREFAVESGAVDAAFFSCLEASNRTIYSWFLDDVDALLGAAASFRADCKISAYAG